MEGGVQIESLPQEVLLCGMETNLVCVNENVVFGFVSSARDLLQIGQVCKLWHALTQEQIVLCNNIQFTDLHLAMEKLVHIKVEDMQNSCLQQRLEVSNTILCENLTLQENCTKQEAGITHIEV